MASIAAADETAASIFGPLGRTALAALGDLAADMVGPAAFLGVLFLPTNSSLISEGTVPGARRGAIRRSGGGLLLLATTEGFSMDNPAHLAVADAIQAPSIRCKECCAGPSQSSLMVHEARGFYLPAALVGCLPLSRQILLQNH